MNELAIGGRIINLRENLNMSEPVINNVNAIDYNSLILRCKTDKRCLEILYNSLKKGVFAIAYSIVKDHHLAEDCVAETFVRLVNVKRFSAGGGDGKGFIFKIARNVAMEQYRRYKREDYDAEIHSCGNDRIDRNVEDSFYLDQLLKNLNDKQRQVVILRCYNDLSFKEIGSILKIPVTTVKSRYKKSIEILQGKAGVKL